MEDDDSDAEMADSDYHDATDFFRTMSHDTSARLSQLPLAPAVSASASNLAQSREADDSSMLPLSDPE